MSEPIRMAVRENAPPKDKMGLKDGGHVYVRCSACEAILLDVYRTMPNAVNPRTGKVFEWKLQANCPFCGDHSYVTEVTGMFHLGGMGHARRDNVDDDIPSTTYDPPEINGNVYKINVRKAKPDAKPVKHTPAG